MLKNFLEDRFHKVESLLITTLLVLGWYGFSSLFNWFLRKLYDDQASSLSSCAFQFLFGWILPLVIRPAQCRVFKQEVGRIFRVRSLASPESVDPNSKLIQPQSDPPIESLHSDVIMVLSLCHLLGNVLTTMSLKNTAVFYVHLIKVG
jgi:hypothetical protein